ncbi:MAG: anti-sigma factor family protein, partial [Candidatus Binatia bacterium]
MDCAQAQELTTALVDDELSGPERAAIEEHIKQCSKCRFAHARELALKTEVQRAGAVLKAPAELREKILHDPRVFAPKPARRTRPVRNATPYLR